METKETRGLTIEDWKSAIEVQDACNLSGVVHSLSRILPRIREEQDCSGTDYVNSHPIVVMYVSKLVQLSGLDDSTIASAFTDAYQAIQKKIS